MKNTTTKIKYIDKIRNEYNRRQNYHSRQNTIKIFSYQFWSLFLENKNQQLIHVMVPTCTVHYLYNNNIDRVTQIQEIFEISILKLYFLEFEKHFFF